MHPTAEELASVPLFAGLEPTDRQDLAEWFEIEERQPGSALAREGAAGYAFYVLVTGTATVRQGDSVIRELAPGDCFGELSIVGDGRRTATVTATSPAIVWSMFGTRFRLLESQFPALAERIRGAYA